MQLLSFCDMEIEIIANFVPVDTEIIIKYKFIEIFW